MTKWFLIHKEEIIVFDSSVELFAYTIENVATFEDADFTIIAGEGIEYKNGERIN